MNPAHIAEQIGIDLEDWKGNCYGIACAMLDAGIVEGRAVHGCYLGKVAPGSLFSGHIIPRHGWIEKTDGTIIDPTRWVFESVEPYIYQAKLNKEYDEACSALREAMMRPQPDYDSNDKQITLPDTKESFAVKSVLGIKNDRNIISMQEAFWLANLPMSYLSNYMKPIYDILIMLDLRAFIPIDHRIKVYGRQP